MAVSTKQKQARKKKRISKHMQTAVPPPAAIPDELKGVELPTAPPKKQPRKKSSKKHTKDPTQVAQYLSAWKHRASGTNWKFNKNTQSWIVRHMYEAEKLTKPVFELCLEYLGGVGEGTKMRVVEDAKEKARRYKLVVQQSQSEITPNKDDTKQTKKKPTITDEDDETRWKKLDDHSKRKEYKRARKVLETLKQEE